MRQRLVERVQVGLALAPLVFLSERIRVPVEGSMPLHMLLQFPLLFVAGACIAMRVAVMRPAVRTVSTRIDAQGLVGLVVLSGVAALWMVPAALDAALMDPSIAAWKYASWWFAGAVTPHAWSRMASPLRLFLLGNLAWMLLTAGALYADSERRLCVSYTIDEQAWTAIALQVAGTLVVAAGIAGALGTRRCGQSRSGSAGDSRV
jgi:hypothetical protein